MEPRPVLPQAGPSLGPNGQLTYLDEQGVRHVSALPKKGDEATVDRLMAQIQQNQSLFDLIQRLSQQWIEQMETPDFATREAIEMLLTTLETGLETLLPEGG
jgi:hypothetical protein